MVANGSPSHDSFYSRSSLFMESPPAGFHPDAVVAPRRIIRRVVIAASTAAVVYLLIDLLTGVGIAG